jgi:hypothetical protein
MVETTGRRCLVMGTFNMDVRAWSGVPWEFADVISRIEEVDLVAPPDRFYDKDNPNAAPPLAARIDAKLRRIARRHVPRMPVTRLTQDYDLAFYICHFIYEIEELAQIRDWRGRSQKAALFLLEGWPATFAQQARTLALLDRFDHVFVLNGSSIGPLSRYTSTPISQLSTATDVLRTTPVPDHPARVVDLCCIGRNDPEVHAALLELSRERGLFYHYDVWKNQNVAAGWEQVRRWNADLIRRSRFYLVWDPAHRNARRDHAGDMQALSTRYFEGTAGGAILLGSAPDCPEYHAAFDWPDAVIPLAGDPAGVLDALTADPVRCARLRAENIRQSLLRHDWAHRWRQVLHSFDLAPTPAHREREDKLVRLAGMMTPERAAGL